jgi:uncharacterized protein YndB with AHSA1/START domain
MPQTLDSSIAVAAPVDRAWELVSTSAGLSGWFVDATIMPGTQGSVTLRFAPGAEGTVPILAWEPRHRIRFGMAGARVHDITVTATASGCLIQLRDEGVPDAEADATALGWQGYLAKLRRLAETGQ